MEYDGEKMEGNRGTLKRSRIDFEDDKSIEDDFEYNNFDNSEEEEWRMEDESEEMDSEQDTEDHEYTMTGDANRTVKIRLSLTDGQKFDLEFKSTKRVFAECTCDGVTVATALAWYIPRLHIHSKFWEYMEELTEELSDIAFHVFD